jgi:hypothetical protein
VLAYVYGFVQLELLEPSRKLDEDVELQRRNHTASYLMQQVSSGDYPTLARVFSDASNLTASDAFETGLNYVLDGIAMHAGVEKPGDPAAIEEPDDSAAAQERASGHLRRGRRRVTG